MSANELEISIEKTMSDSSAINWTIGTFLSSFSGLLIPFANIAAPLVIWLIKRNSHPFFDKQSKEVINFQLSITLYIFIISIVMAVATWATISGVVETPEITGPGISGIINGGMISGSIITILSILNFIMMIIGAIKASGGKFCKLPLSIRFIK